MPLSAHVNDHLWAISSDGAVFFTPSMTPSWRCITLSSPAVTLSSVDPLDTIFLACEDGTLHVFSSDTGQLLRSSPTPLHSRPLCLAIVPNEQAIFAGLADGAVVRVHLSSLAFDCMLGCGVEHASAVHALAVDNHYLYSAGDDAVVLVWDLKDLTTVRDFSVSAVPIRSLLRVEYVLWIGLHNGCVQVIEIFGDDLNGVTNVSAKKPHNSPVIDLIQVGQTQVWSLEARSPFMNVNEDELAKSNVAVWNVTDFTYVLSEDVEDVFVKAVSVLRSQPFHRVTVAALSPDLSAQLVISDVIANTTTTSSTITSPPAITDTEPEHNVIIPTSNSTSLNPATPPPPPPPLPSSSSSSPAPHWNPTTCQSPTTVTTNQNEDIHNLRRRLDEAINRADIAEADARAMRNERDILRDDVAHEREQAERTLSSLEGLLRERTATIEARDSEIEELRMACDKSEFTNRRLKDYCKKVETELAEASKVVRDLAGKVPGMEDMHRKMHRAVEKKDGELRDTLKEIETIKLAFNQLQFQCSNLNQNSSKNIINYSKKDVDHDENDSVKKSDVSVLREEVDLLKSEVDHRQAAASLYEEEAENMKCVIGDLRTATNELQDSLDRSDEESRKLYTQLEETRATLRMRDMRIARLEGRIVALTCCSTSTTTSGGPDSDGVDVNSNDNENNKPMTTLDDNTKTDEEQEKEKEQEKERKMESEAKVKALEALLASANGEINQMSSELEAMYKAQIEADKELKSVYEGIAIRDERIRKRDAAIEALKKRTRTQCAQSGQISPV